MNKSRQEMEDLITSLRKENAGLKDQLKRKVFSEIPEVRTMETLRILESGINRQLACAEPSDYAKLCEQQLKVLKEISKLSENINLETLNKPVEVSIADGQVKILGDVILIQKAELSEIQSFKKAVKDALNNTK